MSINSNIYYKQLDNRNYLSPIGFRFSIARFPKVSFFCNRASIPEISLGVANQPSYLKGIPQTGDTVQYGQLPINFIVDEDLVNYSLIHNWITGIGFPRDASQFEDITTDDQGVRDYKLQYSDVSLTILNSNYNEVANVKFWDAFPVSLSTLDFTATDTDINYLTATATFEYTYHELLGTDNKPLRPDYVNQSLQR